MLKGDKFVVSFPELIDTGLGEASDTDVHTADFYASENKKKTMCCNCAKAEEIPPDPIPIG